METLYPRLPCFPGNKNSVSDYKSLRLFLFFFFTSAIMKCASSLFYDVRLPRSARRFCYSDEENGAAANRSYFLSRFRNKSTEAPFPGEQVGRETRGVSLELLHEKVYGLDLNLQLAAVPLV